MVPPEVALAAFALFAALVIDRVIGDPHSAYHPVALLGRFIGWWGKPGLYSEDFSAEWSFFLGRNGLPVYPAVFLFAHFAPWWLFLCGAPFLLKGCFAWRSLEEHTRAVVSALNPV